MIQQFLCGRGKVLSEKRARSASVRKCHFGSLPNDLDGMSVIWFRVPATCIVVRGDTRISLMQNARMHRSCPDVREPLDAMRSTQLTVD